MDIKIQELKKVISSPVVIFLTILFILYNMLTIHNNSYIKEDIKILNNIVGEFGYEINDKTIANMKLKCEEGLQKLNSITKSKLNEEYSSISEFIESEEYERYFYGKKKFSDEEMYFFNELSLLDAYSVLAVDLVQSYENIDIRNVIDGGIESIGLEGKAKEISLEKSKELEKRFEELKESEEYKNLSILGNPYRLYTFLFKDILSQCIYEIIILIVLISSYLINYEFDNKTSLLVYSTKRGRNNTNDKLLVCLFTSIIVSILILGTTLVAYFIVFDHSEVLNVPISSAFNWEYNLPHISWFNITFLEKLLLSIGIILICAPIFSMVTFMISKSVKNSYIVFFIFFIVFGINLVIPMLASKGSPLMMYLNHDVFNMIISPSSWLMYKGQIVINKSYELTTIIWWIGISILGSMYCIKKFKARDIS